MAKRKRWRDIASSNDLNRVKVGTKIRNGKTGQEFEVVKVLGMVGGTLQIETRPLTAEPTTFAYRDGKWNFA